MTIHVVDTIDEVLKFALETVKVAEVLETPQIWSSNAPSADISATIE